MSFIVHSAPALERRVKTLTVETTGPWSARRRTARGNRGSPPSSRWAEAWWSSRCWSPGCSAPPPRARLRRPTLKLDAPALRAQGVAFRFTGSGADAGPEGRARAPPRRALGRGRHHQRGRRRAVPSQPPGEAAGARRARSASARTRACRALASPARAPSPSPPSATSTSATGSRTWCARAARRRRGPGSHRPCARPTWPSATSSARCRSAGRPSRRSSTSAARPPPSGRPRTSPASTS